MTAAGVLGLFVSAFVSATLVPMSSDVVLAALIAAQGFDVALLVLVATVGNTLGALVNWLLGRFFSHFRERRWFPVGPQAFDRAVRWYSRYGVWSLLFAWLPVVGDPLTLAAGLLRTDLRWFVLLVTIGKLARYLAIAAGFLWWSQ